MPAKFINSPKYVTPDGKECVTLKESQQHELGLLVPETQQRTAWTPPDVADWILENGDAIVAILKQRERKRQSPERKAKRTRKTTTEPATA